MPAPQEAPTVFCCMPCASRGFSCSLALTCMRWASRGSYCFLLHARASRGFHCSLWHALRLKRLVLPFCCTPCALIGCPAPQEAVLSPVACPEPQEAFTVFCCMLCASRGCHFCASRGCHFCVVVLLCLPSLRLPGCCCGLWFAVERCCGCGCS